MVNARTIDKGYYECDGFKYKMTVHIETVVRQESNRPKDTVLKFYATAYRMAGDNHNGQPVGLRLNEDNDSTRGEDRKYMVLYPRKGDGAHTVSYYQGYKNAVNAAIEISLSKAYEVLHKKVDAREERNEDLRRLRDNEMLDVIGFANDMSEPVPTEEED